MRYYTSSCVLGIYTLAALVVPSQRLGESNPMSDEISIAGLNKAAVLAALFNGSRPQGLGFLQYRDSEMTAEMAQSILDSGMTYFDYL